MRQTADQRRESVLAAATAALAAKGLYGSTTEQIARQAGISQPDVFRLFGSKTNLFIAVLTRALAAADDHGGRRGDAVPAHLAPRAAAGDEPQVRAQILAARVSGRTDPPSKQTHIDIRARVLRFAADTTDSTTAPQRNGGSAQPPFRPRKTK